jgi:hypothetical protein
MDIDRDVQLVLAEWRDAERRLDAADPGSDEADDARRDVGRLAIEYQNLAAGAAHAARREREP